jgi:hypothetical protein
VPLQTNGTAKPPSIKTAKVEAALVWRPHRLLFGADRMHVLMHASHLFSRWYQSKRRARAFANEEIEHQALLCSLELNMLAQNHTQLHLMDVQMKRTQDDLYELERMIAGIEEARYRCAG